MPVLLRTAIYPGLIDVRCVGVIPHKLSQLIAGTDQDRFRTRYGFPGSVGHTTSQGKPSWLVTSRSSWR